MDSRRRRNSLQRTHHSSPALQHAALGEHSRNGSHKGYGLACVVDILSGILSGTSFGMYPGRPNFAHMVAAYNIDAFTELDDFKNLMDDFLITLKDTPPAPGHERVYYGGLPRG